MDASVSPLSANKVDQPLVSTSASGHHAESSLKSQGKHCKLDSGNSPRRRKRVHWFLDLEAQHEDDEEETIDEEEQDPFFVPDGMIEDGQVTLLQALDHSDTIAQHFKDSTGDRSKDPVSEDEDTTVLDTTGIWEMIYFKYGKYLNIQYWEDFISDLAFKGVDKRQVLFKSIVLDEHRRRLAHYVSPVVPHPTSIPPPFPSVSPASPPSQGETVMKMWFVRIIPASSALYIASMWNKAGLAASEHKLLWGCVTVSMLDPSTFMHVLPLSHSSSVNCYSLVPAEEYICPFGIAALKPQDIDIFTLPITHFTHSDAFHSHEDENQCHRSKEVLIIGRHYMGWWGSLVSIGKDTCVVACGNSALETFETSVVVIRGEHAMLNGILLTPAQSIEVSDAFTQGQRPEVVNRQCTPPPEGLLQPVASSSFTPWLVDGDDIAGLNALTPTSAFDFLQHPSVTISLQRYCAVFKIKPGWKDTYSNRHD
ncbi:hypothetical protein PAXRUDRAFT_15683 [Paxillus rubicundulus Ve08.2h10]|uniref:Uncharacterized protein n=1 Tax=Paxillus rubicundulus Ve08.2h10 TaxID=930991 RepID=A0A0D0DH00_9AGAM|nr:hypothetical protein PAXRUDRAFT_15683 [Paxillus rubicundulus Ve08.2h10]